MTCQRFVINLSTFITRILNVISMRCTCLRWTKIEEMSGNTGFITFNYIFCINFSFLITNFLRCRSFHLASLFSHTQESLIGSSFLIMRQISSDAKRQKVQDTNFKVRWCAFEYWKCFPSISHHGRRFKVFLTTFEEHLV